MYASAVKISDELIRDKNKLYISPQYPLHLSMPKLDTTSKSPNNRYGKGHSTSRSRNEKSITLKNTPSFKKRRMSPPRDDVMKNKDLEQHTTLTAT